MNLSKHNPYLAHGCEDRDEYLQMLADEHDVPYGVVRQLAELLGPSEDFDGLVSTLEDYVFLETIPNITNMAAVCKQLIAAAEADGVEIDDGNVVDLIADNCPWALGDIRLALVAAGLAERFPRATHPRYNDPRSSGGTPAGDSTSEHEAQVEIRRRDA